MQETERDLVGYAGRPPVVAWPGGARIAVNFVLNYEEGAETLQIQVPVAPASLAEMTS